MGPRRYGSRSSMFAVVTVRRLAPGHRVRVRHRIARCLRSGATFNPLGNQSSPASVSARRNQWRTPLCLHVSRRFYIDRRKKYGCDVSSETITPVFTNQTNNQNGLIGDTGRFVEDAGIAATAGLRVSVLI